MGLGSLAVVAGMAAAAWYSSEEQKVRRLLRKTPAKPIGDVGDDEVAKVIGRARPLSESLSAPLTGRACVYFIAMVEERRTRRNKPYWKTIAREERGVPFALEDDTGRAIVDPTATRIAMSYDAYSTSGVLDDPTDIQRAFLDRHDNRGDRGLYHRKLRYHEAVIADGETVAVLGAGTREPDPDGSPTAAYRGEAPTRLRLTSSRKYPLVISDDRRSVTG